MCGEEERGAEAGDAGADYEDGRFDVFAHFGLFIVDERLIDVKRRGGGKINMSSLKEGRHRWSKPSGPKSLSLLDLSPLV